MLSIVIDVHRNILAAQCFVKFCGNDTSVDRMEIIGSKNCLTISFSGESESLHKIKIPTPKNFFIPTSVSSDVNVASCTNEKKGMGRTSQKLQDFNALLEPQVNSDSKYLPDCARSLSSEISTPGGTKIVHPILEVNENCFKLLLKINCSCNHSSGSKHIINANFRLQFTNSEVIPCNDNVAAPLPTLHKFLRSQIKSDELHNVVCTNCDTIISTKPIFLTDVKEYNANFSDLSESWFCHKHDNTCPVMSKETLYVDDLCILLDFSFVENPSLEKQGAEYKCKTCNNILTSGIVACDRRNFRRFFIDAVKLNLPCSIQIHDKKYQHDIVMVCLLNIIKNSMSDMSACKLYFQSNVEGNEDCLLLRIFPFQATQFTFQSTIENIPDETDLITDKVYKVQYHISSKSSTIVKLWRREFDVEFFKVSYFFLEVVKQHLKSSSSCIPSGQTAVKNFFNACLPSTYENCLSCCL